MKPFRSRSGGFRPTSGNIRNPRRLLSRRDEDVDKPSDVARQIQILLIGLAKRADSAGLTELAARLRTVAAEAEQWAAGGPPKP